MFAVARAISSASRRTFAVRSLSTSSSVQLQQQQQQLDPVQKAYIEQLRKYQQKKDAQRNSDVPMNEEAKRKYQEVMGRVVRQFGLSDKVAIPELTKAPALKK